MPNDAEFLHEVIDGTRDERLQRIVDRQMAEFYARQELYRARMLIADTTQPASVTLTSDHVSTTITGPVIDTLSRYTPITWSYNANV